MEIKYFSRFYYTILSCCSKKYLRLNSTHYFAMKIPNKKRTSTIAFNHSSDINFQDFMNLYKKFTAKPYSFLVIVTTLTSDNF